MVAVIEVLNLHIKEEAQLWMKKAEEVAEMDADKKRYHNKLDLLISSSIDHQP